jgi:hypothetical protein
MDSGERIAAVSIALGMSSMVPALLLLGEGSFRPTFHCNRSRRIVLEDADMGIVIGPVLRRANGYRFDTWTASKGVIRGYPYRRIEDAYYARNAEIKVSAQGRGPSAIVCQTLDEFIAKSAGYEMLVAA